MAKKNREERRREKFGGGRANEHGGWPTSRPNPVFGGDDPSAASETSAPDDKIAPDDTSAGGEATAGRPDQDQTHATGAGTGGATEQAGRAPRRHGSRAANSAKG